MESCYEYLGCDKKDCIMHARTDTTRCWEIDGTSCNHFGIQMVRNSMPGKKEAACIRVGCIYYKAAKASGVL
jgi:hypothetical protein